MRSQASRGNEDSTAALGGVLDVAVGILRSAVCRGNPDFPRNIHEVQRIECILNSFEVGVRAHEDGNKRCFHSFSFFNHYEGL